MVESVMTDASSVEINMNPTDSRVESSPRSVTYVENLSPSFDHTKQYEIKKLGHLEVFIDPASGEIVGERVKAIAGGAGEIERRRIFEDPTNKNAVIERFESIVGSQEAQPQMFDDNIFADLYRALAEELAGQPELRNHLINMLKGRYIYNNMNRAMQIGAVDNFAELMASFDESWHRAVLTFSGMKAAARIIERNQNIFKNKAPLNVTEKFVIARAVLRENISQELGPRAEQEALIARLSSYSPAERNRIFGSPSLDGLSDDEKDMRATIDALIAKPVELARRGLNLTGVSAIQDGLRMEGTGELITDLITEVWVDWKGERINILDPRNEDKIRAIKDQKEGYPPLIAMAWDRALRDFIVENYDRIDKFNSWEGDAPGLVKKDQGNPIRYERGESTNQGRAKYLRRYTYVGVLALPQITGRFIRTGPVDETISLEEIESTLEAKGSYLEEQVGSWRAETGLRLAYSGRIRGGDKVRKMFTDEAPNLLNDPNVINARDLSPIVKIVREGMGYLPHNEQIEMAGFWLQGLIEFMRHENMTTFGYKNINTRDAVLEIERAKDMGLIDQEMEDIVMHKVLGPPLLIFLAASLQAGEPGPALAEMIKAFFKAIVSSK